MRHDGRVNGALLMPDGRILSWSEDNTLRLWNVNWPKGTTFDVACALLLDPNLRTVSDRYEISINEPICDHPANIPLPIGTVPPGANNPYAFHVIC